MRKRIDELERLYELRYPQFLRVAAGTLGDREQGRDAVHEAFVRAVGGLDRFRGESSLETWVWRILANVCTSDQRRERELSADPPERACYWKPDETRDVREAVAALPPRQRLIVFLRHYADLDYEQIASAIGVERGTVAATLHAAHARLRDVLSEVPR